MDELRKICKQDPRPRNHGPWVDSCCILLFLIWWLSALHLGSSPTFCGWTYAPYFPSVAHSFRQFWGLLWGPTQRPLYFDLEESYIDVRVLKTLFIKLNHISNSKTLMRDLVLPTRLRFFNWQVRTHLFSVAKTPYSMKFIWCLFIMSLLATLMMN